MENKETQIEHVNTKMIVADALTKPVTRENIKHFLIILLNITTEWREGI